MKKILIAITLFTLLPFLIKANPPVNWLNGSWAYKTKIQTIKKDKVPIILYIYTTWCPYCKKMNKKLANSKVQDYLKGFTKIAINGGKKIKSKNVKKIMQKYKITGFPSLILIYPNGKYKNFYIKVELSDSNFIRVLKRKIGRKAYRMSKKGNKISKLNKKEIAELYSNNGTKPKIIEISDEEGEHTQMRAYKVITEDPQSKFYNNTGDIYFNKGKYRKAKGEYFESLKYSKKNQRSYYNLARVYYILSRKEKDAFRKLKFLKKAKIYAEMATEYSGIYLENSKTIKKQIEKAIKKENKKYKVIK